jgi:hypothetical protein
MTDPLSAMALPMPTKGVDPRIALATCLQAAPGVFAVLLGSGMSSSAGIPTGWQVTQDLIRRIARADGIDNPDLAEHPERWWRSIGHGEPRYDELVAALGLTDATRQAILRRYFDPSVDEGGPIRPSQGHRSLAGLVASGRVRVIITTNFDRLVERALDEAGVAAQVISSSSGVRGMTPLRHAQATVLKVNGDYLSFGQRHTPAELAAFPLPWRRVLGQVFDEYGLLVIGWSAEYDTALSEALSGAVSRRYPVFWTIHRGNLQESAKRLVDQRGATLIDIPSGDDFLNDLATRVDRIEAVASRRGRPAARPVERHRPDQRTSNQGWAVQPLLVLRATAGIGPTPADTLGRLRQENRDRLLVCLAAAPLTARLQVLTRRESVSALGDRQRVDSAPLEGWQRTPGGLQNAEYGSYRLGGDATSGVSAVIEIRPDGGSILVTIDVGVSLAERIALADACLVLRDALALATQGIPESLGDFLPPDIEVEVVEVHLLASDQNSDGTNRSNDLGQCMDLGALGMPSGTRTVTSMGYAASVASPLSEQAPSELIVQALDDMALDSGYLDTQPALTAIRRELGPLDLDQ